MSWSNAQVALLQENREVVVCKRTFEVTFDGTPFRLVEDVIPRTIGGLTYAPARGWLSGGQIDRLGSFQSSSVEYRVTAFNAASDDDVAMRYAELCLAALHDEAAWRDAPITQGLQLYDEEAPVGPPAILHRGYIAGVKPSEEASDRSIVITANDIFSRRNYTPLGQYTDRARKAAYPGDRGAEFAPTLRDKRITGWLKG